MPGCYDIRRPASSAPTHLGNRVPAELKREHGDQHMHPDPAPRWWWMGRRSRSSVLTTRKSRSGYRADPGRHAGAVDLGGQVHHAQPSILRCASRLTAIAASTFWILRSAVAGMQARMIQPMNPRSRP